jgi:N-methylhydantoinase B
VVNPDTPSARQLKPLSDNNRLYKGDLLRITTSGGGGWGHPFDRPAERVRDDVLDGFVSVARARDDYGVALQPHTLEIDKEATERWRQSTPRRSAMFHRHDYFEGHEFV